MRNDVRKDVWDSLRGEGEGDGMRGGTGLMS